MLHLCKYLFLLSESCGAILYSMKGKQGEFTAFVVFSLLLAVVVLCACKANTVQLTVSPSPSSAAFETINADTVIIVTIAPTKEQSEKQPEASADAEQETTSSPAGELELSPEITFVPIPPSTPKLLEDGSTASPTPLWATAFPSPDANDTYKLAECVSMGVISNCETKVNVRSEGRLTASVIGSAELGESYRVLSQSGDWCEILYCGNAAYVHKDFVSVTQADCKSKARKEFSICSWNVHNLNDGASVLEAGELIKNVGADVVCLQEVDCGTERVGGRDIPLELAKAAGYPYYFYAPAMRYKGGEYGSVLLSKYPLIDAFNRKLTVIHKHEPRSLGYARILTDGGAVSVFFTHISDAPMCFKSLNLWSLDYELRLSGIAKYVVAGDFNCSPGALDGFLPYLRFTNITENTFGDGTVPKILDNILYTDGIVPQDAEVIQLREYGIGDHDMVFARMIVTGD